jgi:hypothetical protein
MLSLVSPAFSFFLSQLPSPHFPSFMSPLHLVPSSSYATFTLCPSSSPLWLVPSCSHQPTLDPSPQCKPLKTLYLSAQPFHPLHRPTLANQLPSLSFCQLFLLLCHLACLAIPCSSTSQVQCHLQVATSASADRCTCRWIWGDVNIVMRHRFCSPLFLLSICSTMCLLFFT